MFLFFWLKALLIETCLIVENSQLIEEREEGGQRGNGEREAVGGEKERITLNASIYR